VLHIIVAILFLLVLLSLTANYYKREGLTINLSDEDMQKVQQVVSSVGGAMNKKQQQKED